MALIASDILDNVVFTLDDPTNEYWGQPELVSYLNQYCRWALGLKPDLNVNREQVPTVSGVYQSIPADGMQFLDTDFAGNGQAVQVIPLDAVKHSKYQNGASMTDSANAEVACPDPRSPKNFYTFPPSTGSGSTVGVLYSQYMTAPMTDFASAYPWPDETVDSAYWYVLAMCFRKTGDRQDLERAKECRDNSVAWFGLRTQTQSAESPTED